jgi:multiple RNA-binding domain-containing protein 1
VTVEFALPAGDNRLARPWSQHSKAKEGKTAGFGGKSMGNDGKSMGNDGKSMGNGGESMGDGGGSMGERPQTRLSAMQERLEKAKNDPKFQEYLGVMKAKAGTKLWANDASLNVPVKTTAEMGAAEKAVIEDEDGDDDDNDEEYQDLTDIVEGKRKAKKGKANSDDDDDDRSHGSDSESLSNSNSSSSSSSSASSRSSSSMQKKVDNVERLAGMTDLEYLRSKVTTAADKAKASRSKKVKGRPSKLFLVKIAMLPLKLTGAGLSSLVEPFDPVLTHLARASTIPPTQNGFVRFHRAKNRDKAIKKLKGKQVMGKVVQVTRVAAEEASAAGMQLYTVEEEEAHALRKGKGKGEGEGEGEGEARGGSSSPAKPSAAAAAAAARDRLQEDAADSGRLFVRNLPFSATEEDLKALFTPHGEVVEVHVPVDKLTGAKKGFAFVLFALPSAALVAQTALDNTIFQGRLLHVLSARSKAEWDDLLAETDASFAARRDRKAKGESMKAHTWNSLFMSSNAVADSLASRLGVPKTELLDREASSAAVRMALGETSVVAETKRMFAEAGYSLSTLMPVAGTAVARSNTALLIKNLPAGTKGSDMETLFGKYGALAKTVVAPSGAIAVVEFKERNDAKSAFKGCSFRKYKGMPLFLEWCPVEAPPTDEAAKQAKKKEEEVKEKTKGKRKKGEEEEEDEVAAPTEGKKKRKVEDDEEAVVVEEQEKEVVASDQGKLADLRGLAADVAEQEDTFSVFVKNLNFTTTEATLRAVFSTVGPVRSVTLPKKRTATGAASTTESVGYGFVEFTTKDHARGAAVRLDGREIDGHKVIVKLSQRREDPLASGSGSAKKRAEPGPVKEVTTSKLMIRNVPFQATRREISELFGTFGTLKSVRLPKKIDGKHRGFAFVEFATVGEAKRAREELGATHLYGRHLVIEPAAEDGGLEEMREREREREAEREVDRKKEEQEAKKRRFKAIGERDRPQEE